LPTSAEHVVRDFIEFVRSGKQPELAINYMAATVTAHQIISGEAIAIERTPQNYTDHINEFIDCYGTFDLVVEEFIAQQSKVYVRWRQIGVHQNAILGYPATGKTLITTDSAVYRVENEKIVEYWIQQESDGLKAQLKRNAEPTPTQQP